MRAEVFEASVGSITGLIALVIGTAGSPLDDACPSEKEFGVA